MRVRLTRPANGELAAVLERIKSESPSGAARLARRFEEVLRKLADFPGLGRLTDEEGIRRVNLEPMPYMVLYETTDDAVVIHAIRHGARNPDTLRVGPKP